MAKMTLEQLDEMLNDHPVDHPTVDDDKIIRGPFNYYGSKNRSMPYLNKFIPYSNVFVDVCGGSGVVTLNRRPSRKLDVYNDRWSGCVAFYRAISDPVTYARMLEHLSLMQSSKEDFYYCKEFWESQSDTAMRGAMWYYMIQCSYGALGRNWGYSTTQDISHKYRDRLECFPMVHSKFRDVQIENEDFRTILKKYDSPTTVFYIDPPYRGTHQPGSYVHKFTEEDHQDLLTLTFRMQGWVGISHYPDDLYDSKPFTDVREWEISGSNHGAQTETNHRIGADKSVRRTERLYIKDFAK